MTESFAFKKFKVYQDQCAMKVGTDGVLLGAWAHGGRHILDIGSGTGLLCLMMAQRYPEAMVEGVEIDGAAATQSRDNAAASPFADRIVIHNNAIQQFQPTSLYDAIVTNPPYFKGGVEAPERTRNMARHSVTLGFADIFTFAKTWLSEEGELSAVLPKDASEAFQFEASLKGFFLSRKVEISTTPKKTPSRCLLAFTKLRPQTLESIHATISDQNGCHTEWYRHLTKDFYLK